MKSSRLEYAKKRVAGSENAERGANNAATTPVREESLRRIDPDDIKVDWPKRKILQILAKKSKMWAMGQNSSTSDSDIPFVRSTDEGVLVVVQRSIYSIDVILRTAYRFTNKCHVHIADAAGDSVEVRFQVTSGSDPKLIAGEFCNELLDGVLREAISRESRSERDLILAHALSKHPVLNQEEEYADAFSDPVGLLNPDKRCRD